MKNYFLTIDTETTMDNLVVDFGATITDSKGKIVNQTAILVHGVFLNDKHPLFFDPKNPTGIWAKNSRTKRENIYKNEILAGTRMVASVSAINRWLVQARLTYNPILTAFNLKFDLGKMHNTGIDVTHFSRKFCLMHAAQTRWSQTKSFKTFIVENHFFNPPTKNGHMSYRNDAETYARFVLNNPNLAAEPHRALEDILGYELPVLNKLLKSRSVKWLLTIPKAQSWRKHQVKNHFIAK